MHNSSSHACMQQMPYMTFACGMLMLAWPIIAHLLLHASAISLHASPECMHALLAEALFLMINSLTCPQAGACMLAAVCQVHCEGAQWQGCSASDRVQLLRLLDGLLCAARLPDSCVRAAGSSQAWQAGVLWPRPQPWHSSQGATPSPLFFICIRICISMYMYK